MLTQCPSIVLLGTAELKSVHLKLSTYDGPPTPRSLDYDLILRFFLMTLTSIIMARCVMPVRTVRLDEWRHLKELKLPNCQNTIPLLANVSKPRLTLLEFRDMGDRTDLEQRVPALTSMIRRFKTLTTLIIDLRRCLRSLLVLEELARAVRLTPMLS